MRVTREKKPPISSSSTPSTPSPKPNQASEYRLSKCIGRGNFGDVYRAEQKSTSKVVAIKVVNLDESPDDVKQIIKEIHFLSKLRNPNIIQYIESFSQEYNMYIVMEYCAGGSCSDLLKFHKKLPEDVVGYIIKRVLMGLRYLHLEHKVHRDIKLANVLLTETAEVKLGDFGVSTEITMTKMKKKTFVGTPFWMAPEVITRARVGESANNASTNGGDVDGYDEKADIWSTGITTIELVTGAPPLSQYDPLKILFDIPKQRPPTLLGYDCSSLIKDFVKYCLIKDPKQRPCANFLLHHHFLTRNNGNNTAWNDNARTKLMRLIAKKMVHDNHKPGYKPRFGIANSRLDKDKENVETPIEWEFNETLIQQDAKVAVSSSKASASSTSSSPSTASSRDKKNGGETRSVSGSSYYGTNAAAGTGVAGAHNGDNISLISSYNSKGELLFSCLERVHLRARDQSTKLGVEEFINNVHKFEKENPGFCTAVIEEVMKYIRE
ncbi:Sporulation-specific protein 1 [Candida viswanathii]|uniref:non-specific serine/threonine protein kinase n=1 Tax=Candida viswanathii TaxID=5486 RepID=A0A367Y3M6_9ASCO|nr:Sporulation-specific protein 1 [Candida viswanathii]